MNFEQEIMYKLGTIEAEIKSLHEKIDEKDRNNTAKFNASIGFWTALISAITTGIFNLIHK